MRNIILAILLIMLAIPLGAQNAGESSTLTSSYNLQSQVIEMKEYSGSDLGALSLKREVSFGDENRPLREISYNDDGSIKSRIEYRYSESGFLEGIIGYDAANQSMWRYEYSYNENRLVSETSYNAQGAVEWTDLYHYNESGQLTEKITLNSDSSVNLQETFLYNEMGNVASRSTLYGDGSILKRVVYSYNQQGNLTKAEQYDGNGLYETLIYTRNAEGRQIRLDETAADGSIRKRTLSSYSSNGLLIREQVQNSTGEEESSINYVYDEFGNWVRKESASGQFILREISYSR